MVFSLEAASVVSHGATTGGGPGAIPSLKKRSGSAERSFSLIGIVTNSFDD
jgi:hypothetical protein